MAKISFFKISVIILLVLSLFLVSGCKSSSSNPGIEDIFNPATLEVIDHGEITPPDIKNPGSEDELNISKFFPNK